MKAILGALSVLVVLAGCSMHQSVILNPDGSGSADIEVALGPLVVQYMNDVLGSLETEPATQSQGPPLFDLGQIRSAFEGLPGLKLVSLSSPSRSTLRIRLDFSDINAVFAAAIADGAKGSSGPVPLEMTTNAGTKTLRLLLTRETWPAIASLPPFTDDPLLASLGPRGDHHYTEDEYLNLMEYAFADYAGKEKVRDAITSASVDISVTVKGTIVSQEGGTIDGKTVSFRIPLIKLITLAQPVELSITFR